MEEYYRYCSPDHVGKGRKGFLKIGIKENTFVLNQPFLHGMQVPPLFRGGGFPPSASQRKNESVNIHGTQVDGGHPMLLKVRSLSILPLHPSPAPSPRVHMKVLLQLMRR